MTEKNTNDSGLDHSEEEMDWDAFDAISDEELDEALAADPDATPLTKDQLRRARRVPDVRAIRESLGLSQPQFAERFGFSIRTVQEWEQQRSVPSSGHTLYLNAIANPAEFLARVGYPTSTVDVVGVDLTADSWDFLHVESTQKVVIDTTGRNDDARTSRPMSFKADGLPVLEQPLSAQSP